MLSDEGQARIAISLFNAFMIFKSTEEGSDKPANPVINIAGYKATAAEKKEEPKVEPKPDPQPEPIVVVEKPEPQAEPVKTEEPKAEPRIEEPKMEEPVDVAVKPKEKPTPTVELPKPEVKPEPQPQPEVKPEPQPAPLREVLRAPQNTASADAQQYYTVQFLTSNNRLAAGAPELGGIRDFQIIQKGRILTYITGRFATFNEAVAYCGHLKRATDFGDAWVFLYKVQPPLQAAPSTPKPATMQATRSTQASSKGIVYRIQFCTVNKKMKAGDPDLCGLKDIRVQRAGQHFIHTTGDYKSAADAQRRCSEIQSTTPFKDAFVIAIYKGQRITLERAAEIEKGN